MLYDFIFDITLHGWQKSGGPGFAPSAWIIIYLLDNIERKYGG
jgi:hypothetical protein